VGRIALTRIRYVSFKDSEPNILVKYWNRNSAFRQKAARMSGDGNLDQDDAQHVEIEDKLTTRSLSINFSKLEKSLL
jgi:hypothetical protein